MFVLSRTGSVVNIKHVKRLRTNESWVSNLSEEQSIRVTGKMRAPVQIVVWPRPKNTL